MGQNIQITSVSCSKSHQNIIITVITNLAKKKKSLQLKNKKAEVGQSTAFSRPSTVSNYRTSSSSANAICITCNENDAIENLHATGVFHASEPKMNAEHVMKVTSNSRDMAVYIGDNALVNRLMIGDLGTKAYFTTKIVQIAGTTDLQENRKENVRQKLILTK